jgi:hypothetical protein
MNRRTPLSRAASRWIWPLLFLGALAARAEAPEGRPADGERRPPAREAGLEQIETLIAAGFRNGDADRLAEAFSRRIKTYVACAPLAAADGYYGADQMRLLLRRLFRGRETVSFRILEPAARRRPDGLAVLSALWTYRQRAASPAQVRLSFGLAPEAGAWRVREIRDSK